MQDSPKLSLRQTELLGFLDVGAADEFEQLFQQLTLGELRSLVVYLHKSLQQRSTNEAKQEVPRLRLGNVSSSADELIALADEGSHDQSNSATEQGGSLTLLAVGSNINTETPRLDFGRAHDAQDKTGSSQQGPVSRGSSHSLAKQSLIQRAAAAGGYSTKESLDLQLGESIADFDLLASRLGGFGAARRSILSDGRNEQANSAGPASLGRALPAALQIPSSSSARAVVNAYDSSIDRDPKVLDNCVSDAAAAPLVQLGFGSSVSSEDIDLLVPSSSSSPTEAPSSSNTTKKGEQDVVRQSAADMRASALAGPASIKLDDVKEGEGEDAASDTGSSLIPAQLTPERTAATPSIASINVGSPSSLLSTPSTVGSSVSQHIPVETPTAGGSRSGGGLGRVLFAPMNVLRKSLTEKWMPKKPATVAAAATRAPTNGTRAGVTPAAGSSGSTAAAPGQSRLPSFTATAGTAGKSVRPGSRAFTPSSGYRPPSSASSWAATTVSEATIARKRSPLGKPDRPATATAAGPSRGSRLPSSSGSRPAARSPAPAAGTTAIPSRTGSSSASASLAWLQQHSELPASSPAAESSRTPGAGGSRSGSRPAGQSPAAEAAAAVLAAGARLTSGTVTPPGSRPGTSQSTRSAASNATYAGSSTSAAVASSSRIPGFAVTQQMIVGKQQRSTPPSSARTAPPGSARSTASAATTTSAASFMRQVSGVGGVGGVASRRVASVGGADSQQHQVSSPFAGTGSRTPAAGTALTSTAAAAAARRGSGRCNGLLGQASANRVGSGAVSGTGRAAAAGGASQLRRSRSFGSLGELKQQNGHQDVAHIRQMWQKRAVEQQQMQQQQLARQGSRGSSTVQHGIRSPAAATQPRVSRIPSVTLPQQTSAAVGHGIPEPEDCDSPPMQQQRRASSSSGHDVGAAAAAHHPASDLLDRIDDIIQKARTPTNRAASVGAHMAPHSAPPAPTYPASTPSAAVGVQPSTLAAKLSGKVGPGAVDQAGGLPAAVSAAAHTPAGVYSKVAGTPGSDYSKYSLGSSQASHTPGGVSCFGITAKQQQSTPADSCSAGRDQQLKAQHAMDAEDTSRQLF